MGGTGRAWVARMFWAGGSSGEGGEREIGEKSGPAYLSKEQWRAVVRGVEVVERFGGVILADGVGLGKTRVSLEMARRLLALERRRCRRPGPLVVLMPSRLRRSWEEALGTAKFRVGETARIVTHYAMSREVPDVKPGLIVVDEAHRFRNPRASRSRHLARFCAHRPTILVTASPVAKGADDLKVLLRYFLDEEAPRQVVAMGLEAAFEAYRVGEFDLLELLEEVVIRRMEADFGAFGRPRMRFEVLRYVASEEEAWMWQNLEGELGRLTLRALNRSWPRGLFGNTMMRMWESGPNALHGVMEELVHYHERWLEAARAGRRMARPRFQALFEGVERGQQVFSFLYDPEGAPAEIEALEEGVLVNEDEEVRRAVEEDLKRLGGLLMRVKALMEGGTGLEAALLGLVKKTREPVLVFTAYQAAAEAIFRALVEGGIRRVGLITGQGARATGLGRVPGGELLERYEGYVAGGATWSRHEQIRVLVATDCLSEGVNLQNSQVLVLADLPYSPLRLEQRVGRVIRPGSAVREVKVYLPRPEVWRDSLGMRRRLDRRLGAAKDLGAGHALSTNLMGADLASGAGRNGAENPLATMIEMERLKESLRGLMGEGPAFGEISGEERQETLWVRYEVRRRRWRRERWLRVRRDGEEYRSYRLLPGLVGLGDCREEVRAWRPSGALWGQAQEWLRRRKGELEAAAWAPPLLWQGSEAGRFWRRLEACMERGEVRVGKELWQRYRDKVLADHPPGIRAAMETLVEEEATPGAMLRLVESLEERVWEGGEVSMEVVGALWVRGGI